MKISKLILGTVQMGLDYGINNTLGKIKKEESFKILKKAYDLGIKSLDSSEKYGDAHQIIGEFHILYPNCIFNIITKIPTKKEINNINQKIENYLSDLKVNHLECLLFHSFESYKKNKNSFNELAVLKKNKKINNIGVSVYTNDEIEELIEDKLIDVIQIPFNLFDNFSQKGKLIEKAKKNKISIHSRSVFLQGLFFKASTDKNKHIVLLNDEIIKINQIADKENIQIRDLALGYVLHQSSIDRVLIGVDSISQLISNVNSFNVKLNKSVIDNINKIIIKNTNLINPAKW